LILDGDEENYGEGWDGLLEAEGGWSVIINNGKKALQQTLDFIEETLKGSNRVINLKQPKELRQAVDF
jgi:hypothetical protein